MSADTAAPPMQEFRCHSTGEVLEIASQLDSETEKHFVLWKDIQVGFENAKSIRNGKSLVPFLKDAKWEEITPLRIAYYPGTVLDVILDGHNRGHSHSHSHGYSLSHDHNQLYTDAYSTNCSPREICHGTPCMPPVTPVTFADSYTDNNSLAPYYSSADGSHSSSVVVSNPQPNPSLREIMSAQVGLKAVVQQSFDRQSNQIQALQDQLTLTSNELIKTTAELVKNQEEMKEMQKMALDRLAMIHSRVQAVVTQTYELHEYPIPRLFIVLPKDTGVLGKITNPFSQQFRLYFLCECGTHTMGENSKTQHEIHLAKHEGYDLEKPTEFFERYGSYILTLMNMIKYGIMAAGLIVPPLAALKIVEGVDTAQQHMDYLKKNLLPLVDDTISFLEGVKHKNELGEEVAEDHAEFDKLEALEGADLRQLETYLKVKDKGRVLANLYRIATTEGHIKWVCFDHYKATYRQSVVQHLRGIVEVNRGTFVEETGGIEIKIASSTLAKQFYDAMIKARGIQELEITLEWDATMGDLRSLANAISKANVVQVTIDGSHFKSSPLDVVNRGQRFNPILQLASNSRIQVFRLQGFESFWSRINKPTLLSTPKIHRFTMDFTQNVKKSEIQSARDFLGHCSALSTLELNIHRRISVMKMIFEVVSVLSNLEFLKISREDVLVTGGNSKRGIQGADMSIQPPVDLVSYPSKAIQNERLSWMTIRSFPKNEVDGLADVLRGVSSLKHLRIGCHYRDSLAVIDSVISTREKIVRDTGSSCLQIFELMKEDLIPFSTTSYDSSEHIQSHISFQDSSSLFDMRTWIRGSGRASQRFVHQHGPPLTPTGKDLQTAFDFLGYCSTLTTLEVTFLLQHSILKVTSEILRKFQTLKSLRISCKDVIVTAGNTKRMIQDVDMSMQPPTDLVLHESKATQSEHLTWMTIRSFPKNEVDGLADVLRGVSSLKHLRIGCHYQDSLAVIDRVISTREKIVRDTGSSCLQIFELMKEDLIPFNTTSYDSSEHIQSHISFQDSSSLFDMRTWIRKSDVTVLGFVHQHGPPLTPMDKDLQTAFDFLGYCSALTTLKVTFLPQHSILKTTSQILRKVQTLESLKISRDDFMVTAGNTKRMIQGVDMSMQPPADFVLHESNATQNEHLAWMTIRSFPKNEVDGLADVIRGVSSLKHLRIGCYHTSSLAVIDRVISTRESIIQDTGSSCLQTFELMREDLVPFSTTSYDGGDHIQSHISFQDGSNLFDMRTWIRRSGTAALEFMRRYGWSIAFYDGGFQGHVSSSDILNGFGDTKTLQLESLRIQSHKVDADADEIIRRSPNFKDLGLYVNVDYEEDVIGAPTLLSRHAPILSVLSLKHGGDYEEQWEWFVSSFPTRDTLPALEVFEFSGFDPPSKCIPWIVAMVSPPQQQPISPSQPIIQDVIGSQITNLESVAQRPLTRLKRIDLSRLYIQTEEWTSVIEAIDFSELQILNFFNSNLRLKGLRLLVDRIPDNASLKTLDIKRTPAKEDLDSCSLLDTLGRKTPSPTIIRLLELTSTHTLPPAPTTAPPLTIQTDHCLPCRVERKGGATHPRAKHSCS